MFKAQSYLYVLILHLQLSWTILCPREKLDGSAKASLASSHVNTLLSSKGVSGAQ